MDKDLFDFTVVVEATEAYPQRPKEKLLPQLPIPINNVETSHEPTRIWCDLNGNLMAGMWRRALAAVVSLAITRPGVNEHEITRNVCPGLTPREVGDAIDWLIARGNLGSTSFRGDSRNIFAREGYYLYLQSQ